MAQDRGVLSTRSPLFSAGPGVVFRLLEESYAALLPLLPSEKRAELVRDWKAYDAAITEERETIGAAGFLSWSGESLVGFSSWDPRGYPVVGIGHNCIAPGFQGKGLGTLQMRESLSQLAVAGFRMARVRTDEHPFFTSALRMYEKCGFRVVDTEPGFLLPGYRTVVLERGLARS
ncbi:MAG: GNAT family N-acetyltransferase [Gemmatimonadota bacterium]